MTEAETAGSNVHRGSLPFPSKSSTEWNWNVLGSSSLLGVNYPLFKFLPEFHQTKFSIYYVGNSSERFQTIGGKVNTLGNCQHYLLTLKSSETPALKPILGNMDTIY